MHRVNLRTLTRYATVLHLYPLSGIHSFFLLPFCFSVSASLFLSLSVFLSLSLLVAECVAWMSLLKRPWLLFKRHCFISKMISVAFRLHTGLGLALSVCQSANSNNAERTKVSLNSSMLPTVNVCVCTCVS